MTQQLRTARAVVAEAWRDNSGGSLHPPHSQKSLLPSSRIMYLWVFSSSLGYPSPVTYSHHKR